MRVSKADGSQSLDLQKDALLAAGKYFNHMETRSLGTQLKRLSQ